MSRRPLFVLAVLALTGCGPDFTGTYSATGTFVVTGAGGSNTTATTGNVSITHGSSADIIINTPTVNCAIPAKTTGSTFTVVPTSCTDSANGFTLQVNGNGTLNDRIMNAAFNGTVTLTNGGGTGTFTWTLNATKL